MTQRFPKPPAELNRLEEGRFRRLLEAALGQASTKITNVTITQIGGTNLGGALDGDTIRYVTATGKWTRSAFLKNFDTHVTVGTDPGGTGIFRVGGAIRQNSTHFVTLGTITASTLARDDSVTWNNAAVLFTGWRLNVINTGSLGNSKLVDLQIGGTSRFVVGTGQLGTSTAVTQMTAPDNIVTLQVTGNRVTGTGSSEGLANFTMNLNTTGNPSIVHINAVNTGGAGASTQLFRVSRDSNTLFAVLWEGNVGIAGGATSDVICRIGTAVNVPAFAEEGLQVSPTLTNQASLSHWVVSINGAGAASGSAYTTPVVHSLFVGTYSKHTNQTITTWYGLKIEAGPAATTKWAIYTDNSARIGGDLVVTGTITGTLGSGFAALNDLSDVVITAPAVGKYLRYSGTNWIDDTIQAADLPTHVHAAADITSGTFADARIAQSNVTQHQAALTIAETQITDGSLLARIAANETITGAWTFAPSAAASAISITQAVGGRGLVIAGGTQTANNPVLDLSQTWNNAAVAFRGIVLDITDTASLFPQADIIRLSRNGAFLFEIVMDGYMVNGNTYNGYSGHSIVASGSASANTELWFENYGDTAVGGKIFGYVTGGTIAAKTATPAAVGPMLSLAAAGYDGTTDWLTGASFIIRKTSAAWSPSNLGSYFTWHPIAEGATSSSFTMTLDATGLVLGTDPTGSDLLRVGGTTRLNGAVGIARSASSQAMLVVEGTQATVSSNAYAIAITTTLSGSIGEALTGFLVSPTYTAGGSGMTGVAVDIAANSTSFTGASTKYGLRIGSVSGASTNFAIHTSAGLVRFGDRVGVGGDTAASVQLNLTPAVGSKGLVMVGATQTTSQPMLDLTQTWNAGGVTFSAMVVTVTDTASQANSRLAKFLCGSAKFEIDKNGYLYNYNVDSSVLNLALDHGTASGADFYITGTLRASIKCAGSDQLTFLSSGGTTRWTFTLGATPTIGANGTQILTTRRTGYTNAMTGTANRATAYDTSTITLAQLAERVKAIQDDLTTHGLIGA